MNSTLPLRRARAWLGLATLALLTLFTSPGWAQDDPPGRVGRLADLEGPVSWFDDEQGVWSDAERNRPLTSGDRLSTGTQGRAELRIGSTVLRLAAGTELEVLRLDDERLSFQLHSGSLALRVRSREVAREIDVVTGEARFLPTRAGHYRLDRHDDSTFAGVWRGSLQIDDPAGFIVETGQRAELWREGRDTRPGRQLRFAWSTLPGDAFGDWVAREEQRDERSASSRYVSPEMTGAEDLDRHGRWDRHDEYGAIWFPVSVRAEWAPYRYGRWTWVRPWGWTWVDEAPWGFAPFHYGRWVHWRGRWGWVPGAYVARPVYAPALVAWVGGSGFNVSINIGGPAIGWVPLAPREWYRPHHRHTPVYVERVNPHPPGHRHERPAPTGPIMYNNQGVPGAVTVVPRDVLLNRQPVSRGAIDSREWQRSRGREPLVSAAPPEREVPEFRGPRAQPQPQPAPILVQPVPGGGQPVPAPQLGRDGRDRGDGRDRDGRDRDDRDRRRPDPAPAPSMQSPTPPSSPAAPGVIDLRRERQPMPAPATPAAAQPTPQQPAAQPSAQPPQPQQQPPAQPQQRFPREREGERRDRETPRVMPGPQAAPIAGPPSAAIAPARPAAPQPAAPAATPGRPGAPAANPAAAAAPVAAPAPRPTPKPAPEGARDDDRKRAPDQRQVRDRENLR